MLLTEHPNSIMHSFGGIVSFYSNQFMEVNMRNFAMRGSVLRNTSFVIGLVVYVGTETKAH